MFVCFYKISSFVCFKDIITLKSHEQIFVYRKYGFKDVAQKNKIFI